MKTSNILGIIFISITILFIIIGCFYLITKERSTVFFMARIKPIVEKEKPEKTFVFVGDIMLARGVKYEIEKNNSDYSYPFEKIKKFLNNFDIVFGNLEGPIVENPPVFSGTSFKFVSDKPASVALAMAGFNVLSLANNHMDNMLWDGIYETRAILTEQNIGYLGEPNNCIQDFILEKQGILFLAFNTTYPNNCSNSELAEVIKTVRVDNPNQFLIVSLHWGHEYWPTASSHQVDLAHQLIDAGADLIIGQHPHVTQNIELYKNKLIFYSLGNFVFDQYFSKDTQQGLAVGLEMFEKKLVYNLYPISMGQSQPFLMENEEKKEFLKELAERSSQELVGKIKEGVITIK